MNYKKLVACLAMTMSFGHIMPAMLPSTRDMLTRVDYRDPYGSTIMLPPQGPSRKLLHPSLIPKQVENPATAHQKINAKLDELDRKINIILSKLGAGYIMNKQDPFMKEDEQE